MKRLGVYVFISILLTATLGTLTVSAQGIDRQSETGTIANNQGGYPYYQSPVTSYFQAANTALDNIQTRSTSTESIEATKRFKTYVSALETAYTKTFNDEKNKGTKPFDAQLIAIRAFNQARDLPSNLRPIALYSASAPQRSVVSTLSRAMSSAYDVAFKISRNIIEEGSIEAGVLTVEATTITNAATGNTNETKKTSDDSTKCSVLGNNPIIDCVDAAVTWIIKNTLLQIGGFLLWLTANMFSYAVQIGILEFSQWAPPALYAVWVVVRQIVSLIIVFVGLYLGLMYILGRDEKFAKFTPWLIVFALFVNFSYPLARTAIDISNIVSLNIYTSTMGNEVLTRKSESNVGSLIMEKLGLQKLVASATSVKDDKDMLKNINSVPGALVAVAFVFYAAYIFFMVTAIMAIRTAALVFLTIVSPLLLVDSVLPVLGERAQKLRKIFFEQLMVGPVFMIMLALTLKFLSVFSSGPIQSKGIDTLASGEVGSVVTFFNILMMLIMLHIMIKVTREVSGSMGQYATDVMGKVGGFGIGAVSMGTGLLARQAIGGAAARFGASKWVTNNQDSIGGRMARSMTNSLASSTFDFRNTAVAGKMGKIGMGMGMGRKLGFQEASDKRIEAIQKRGETAGERYKEDVKDDAGNIIHRRGDFTAEGRKAYERYNETLGGKSIFMSKEQKLKTKELLKANVLKNVASEESETKKRSEELALAYENIGKHSEDKDKSEGELRIEKDKVLNKMLSDLAQLKILDPQLKGTEAQALSAAINKIVDGKKDVEITLDKKLKDNIARYNAIADTEPNAAGRKAKILDSMDADEQRRFKEKLANASKLDIDLSGPPINLQAVNSPARQSNPTPASINGLPVFNPSQPNQTPQNNAQGAAATPPSSSAPQAFAQPSTSNFSVPTPTVASSGTPTSSGTASSAPITNISVNPVSAPTPAQNREEAWKKGAEVARAQLDRNPNPTPSSSTSGTSDKRQKLANLRASSKQSFTPGANGSQATNGNTSPSNNNPVTI